MALEDKCFTFIWKLENVSFCLEKNAQLISSPDFVVDSIDETKWYLGLYPRGQAGSENYVGFYLFRRASSKGDFQVPIKYELAFVAQDGSVLTLWNLVKQFSNNIGYGFSKFQRRDDVFNIMRSTFLLKDALTVRCRIWKWVGKMTENVRCFARTQIGVQKRSFLWNIKKFSTLDFGKRFTYEVKSLSDNKQLMSINVSLSEGLSCDGIISFELKMEDQAIKFSTLLLSLVDASENRIECNRDEFWFDEESKSKEFKFFFTKNKLIAMKSAYLTDDILSLHWEWAFSKGILSEEIEDVHCSSASSANKSSNSQKANNQKMMMPLSYPLNENLKSLYDENFLCDVKLKASTCEFKAHKVILSASSTVFKAMFSSDMKEKDRNCVNIEDLCEDTISRMLTYIYTARIEDLTWHRASLLYAAADKYAIFSLKKICSSYLKDNISAINACETLLLSEFHSDDDLKSVVQDYIFRHVKDTVNSDGWKLLMEKNSILAAETLSLPYK